MTGGVKENNQVGPKEEKVMVGEGVACRVGEGVTCRVGEGVACRVDYRNAHRNVSLRFFSIQSVCGDDRENTIQTLNK